MNREELTQMYLLDMAEHTLEMITSNDRHATYVYRMGRPAGSIYSTWLIFTPAGTSLVGDFTPTQPGTASCCGYGREWFVKDLNWQYLAEKFALPKEYSRDLAKTILLEGAEEREMVHRTVMDIVEGIDEHCYEWLIERLLDEGIGEPWDMGFRDYRPEQVAALVAIHAKFRELYEAQQSESEATNE